VLEFIVPAEADHTMALVAPPVTVAVNVLLAPAVTVGVAGATAPTTTVCGVTVAEAVAVVPAALVTVRV
jgi:hypothetical protein